VFIVTASLPSSNISASETRWTHKPVKGVDWPKTQSGEGKTQVLGDHQARRLLAAPERNTIKKKRDGAIPSTLLFHSLRREELCKLKVNDAQHALRLNHPL
jgi:integrase/recombinase XerD